MPITRFRPNIILSDCPPHEEVLTILLNHDYSNYYNNQYRMVGVLLGLGKHVCYD